MFITKIKIKDSVEVKLGKFTVLVGPNNVGKSQTLKDIHRKLAEGPNARTTIVTEISIEKPQTFKDLLTGLEVIKDPNNINHHLVRGINSNLTGGDTVRIQLSALERQFENSSNLDFIFGNISKFRVSYLDAGSRLNVAKTVQSYNPHTQPPQNLLQGLFGGKPETELQLRDAFKKMFDMDIRLDYSGMSQLMMRVAKEFGDIPEDPRKAFPVIGKYNKLDDQGDGFKSFVGVVLSLLLSENRVILLDEPEAFLHPAQARQLGFWIAEHATNVSGQIVVATHNANFLAGILSSNHPVDIYRLNRSDNVTTYTRISPEATSNLANSPLLSSQRVLEAIFYKGVVVCEADADRAVYQTVAVREHEGREVLFIHAHNKQTISRVVSLLKEAHIPVCAITDIDITNSETDLLGIFKALGVSQECEQIKQLRHKVASAVEGVSENSILSQLQGNLGTFLSQLEQSNHSLSGARGALNRIRREMTKWSSVKTAGVDALPEGVKEEGKQLIELAKKNGLFIVPVGELESWLELGTRKKNKWVVSALQHLHDGKCTAGLRDFVHEIIGYLKNSIS